MIKKVRVFLDTSVLFAGIWSESGGARAILKLGEARAIHLIVAPQVVAEIESVIRRKAPHLLSLMALLLDAAEVEVVAPPSREALDTARLLVAHPGDAEVLAAALDIRPDYFVTLDRAHFLDVPALRASVPFPIGTPGDFLAWWREMISADVP